MGNWTGDALTFSAGSSVISVTVNKVASDVSISLTDSELIVGDSVTISGAISPSRSGATVIMEYRLVGATSWSQLTTLTTNANGQYSYPWSPTEAGEYEVRVRWDGDSNTTGDNSTEESVLVEAAGTGFQFPIPLYAIVAIVIVVVVVVAAVYFLKFRKSR